MSILAHRSWCVVKNGGAKADGVADDWAAIMACLGAAKEIGGCVRIPAGLYRITKPLGFSGVRQSVSILGEGSGVVAIFCDSGNSGLVMSFEQWGARQTANLSVQGVTFVQMGLGGTAVRVSYGEPAQTSEHFRAGPRFCDVQVAGSDDSGFECAVELGGVWNAQITDCFFSGCSRGGDWNALSGAAIRVRRMCVNLHISNTRANFFAVGIDYAAEGGPNTEGIFCSNCSMVAVKRGVWLRGNPATTHARVSTLTWMGGMIELRVGGVTDGSAAFHLDRVWTALIAGTQMLCETLDCPTPTYGVFADTCQGVVVQGCDINAFRNGVWIQGQSAGNVTQGCTFKNTSLHVLYGEGVQNSRSSGHSAADRSLSVYAAEESCSMAN